MAVALLLAGAAPALAQASGQVLVTREDGFGRMVLSFPGRDTLPAHVVRYENNVLSIIFSDPVDLLLPDVASMLGDYISVARMDDDRRGVRFAMRAALGFNRTEAGERLFIDLLPPGWQGPPPPLPVAVVEEMAERARLAAIDAERARKARGVVELDPRASVRVGRNPTFLRLQIDWTIDTLTTYVQEGEVARLSFEWPVEVDVRALAVDLPPEIVSVVHELSPDGTEVTLTLAEGVAPRFYALSEREYILDIDVSGSTAPVMDLAALAEAVSATAPAAQPIAPDALDSPAPAPQVGALRVSRTEPITPFVSTVGETLRVVFPFDEDVPAAVFRRGNTLWMIFDTDIGIAQPREMAEIERIASVFEVAPAGGAQVVRIALSRERLATLGSEGRSWVLSLGDAVLGPTEPVGFTRGLDGGGGYRMSVDLARPASVHRFLDPLVGDVLEIVTAYPPARGVTRGLEFVDFSALRSVHGLVIKPGHDEVVVRIEGRDAVVTAPGGLTLSDAEMPGRSLAAAEPAPQRTSFLDLSSLHLENPLDLLERSQALAEAASRAEGRARDAARLDLALHYLANDLAHEALGVLRTLEAELQASELANRIHLARAIAGVLAHRPGDALPLLAAPRYAEDIDALIWKSIARAENHDYRAARQDALAAELAISGYPEWVRTRFYFAAARAAVETEDARMAARMLDQIGFSGLEDAEASLFQLLVGRVDELEGRFNEALDTYGQVIAAEVRPTRAEAIYRTLRLLEAAGTLDLARAAETLAAESMLWRGDPLEAQMQAMLAEIYFRDGAYREGFETVRAIAALHASSPAVSGLAGEAQRVFVDLFLNGAADALGPIDALGLYYDFRHLTPPGTRGDEMIRNLARRLVGVDLLAQAAELLQYQIDNRLSGAAQAQVATDLAVIYLADRKPQLALQVLNATRLPDMSGSLVRQRRILEARALVDLGRHELALDFLRDMSGRDVEMLRVEANWKAGRYADAAALLEAAHYDPDPAVPMSEAARSDIVRAAVGYVLAGDRMGLSRLRTKYAERLGPTPEWASFDFVTSSIEPTSLEFRRLAREVAGLDSLNAFLAAYRQAYSGEDILAPRTASDGVPLTASR